MFTKNIVVEAKELPIIGEVNKFSVYASRKLAKEYRKGIKKENRSKLLGYTLMSPKGFSTSNATFREDLMMIEVRINRKSSILIPSFYTSKDTLVDLFRLSESKSLKKVYNFDKKIDPTYNINNMISENFLNESMYTADDVGTKVKKNKDISIGVGSGNSKDFEKGLAKNIKSFADDFLTKYYDVPESHYVVDIPKSNAMVKFIDKKIPVFSALNKIKKTFSNPRDVVTKNFDVIASKNKEELQKKTAMILNKVFDGQNAQNKAEFIHAVVTIFDNPDDVAGWLKKLEKLSESKNAPKYLLSEEEDLFKAIIGPFSDSLEWFENIPSSIEQGKKQQAPEDKYSGVSAFFNSGGGRILKKMIYKNYVRLLYRKAMGKKTKDSTFDIEKFDKEITSLFDKISSGDIDLKDASASQGVSLPRKVIRTGAKGIFAFSLGLCFSALLTGYGLMDTVETELISNADKGVGITKTLQDAGAESQKQAQKGLDQINKKQSEIQTALQDLPDEVDSAAKESLQPVKDNLKTIGQDIFYMKLIASGITMDDIGEKQMQDVIDQCKKKGCSKKTMGFLELMKIFSNADGQTQKQISKYLRGSNNSSPEGAKVKKILNKLGVDSKTQVYLVEILSSETIKIRRGNNFANPLSSGARDIVKDAISDSGMMPGNLEGDIENIDKSISTAKQKLQKVVEDQIENINSARQVADSVKKTIESDGGLAELTKDFSERNSGIIDHITSHDSMLVQAVRGLHMAPVIGTLETVRAIEKKMSDEDKQEIYPILQELCEDPRSLTRLTSMLGIIYILTLFKYWQNSSGEIGSHVKNAYDGLMQDINIFTLKQVSVAIAVVQMTSWAAASKDFKSLIQNKTLWQKAREKFGEEEVPDEKIRSFANEETDFDPAYIGKLIQLKQNLSGISARVESKTETFQSLESANISSFTYDCLKLSYTPPSQGV